MTFGSRDPASARVQEMLQRVGHGAACLPSAEAVRHAEVVVLATPWTAVEQLLGTVGDLQGKVLVDATNAIAPGLRPLFGAFGSAAEQVTDWTPGARVVKAFNTTGAENMRDPVYAGEPTLMMVCGDDVAAKEIVMQLAAELGFAPEDAGGLVAARHLEALALLWIHLANVQGMGRDIAFRLVKRRP